MTTPGGADFIARSEYEAFVRTSEIRHGELRLEVKEDVSELKAQLTTLSNKMDTLSSQIASKGNDGWKLLATCLSSLISGYLLYYVQHLLVH